MMKVRLLVVMVAAVVFGVTVHAAPVLLDRIVAVVDNAIILQSDVEKKLHFEIMSRGLNIRTIPATQLEDMFNKVLENEIQRHLLLAKAEEDSIEADDELIEEYVRAEIRRLKDQNGETAFQEELERQGLTERQVRDEFRQQYRNQFLERRMYETLAQQVSNPSPRDLDAFRESYLTGQTDFLALSHILVEPEPSGDRQAAARKEAEGLLEQIRSGADFAALAREHSDDPGSASQGGDLGYFSRGTMVPAFEEAAFALKPGEVSDVVQSEYGFHIIRVDEVAADQVRARHILILLRANEEDAEAAHQEALDLYKRIQAGEDFEALAREHSDYEPTAKRGGQMGVYPKNELPPDFGDAVRALQPDQVTLPIKTDLGWNLVKINADQGSLEEILRQKKLQDLFRQKLEETREKLYVDVRLGQ